MGSELEVIVDDEQKEGLGKRMLRAAFPILRPYDAKKEAKDLLKDKEVQATGITDSEAARYLETSYKENERLYFLGGLADSGDRVTALAFGGLEIIGYFFAGAPGVAINVGEQAIEHTMKGAYLLHLGVSKKEWGRVAKLAAVEGVFAPVPGIEDVVDVATNLFYNDAKDVIRERAKDEILRDYAKND